jgi:hypothetical protein
MLSAGVGYALDAAPGLEPVQVTANLGFGYTWRRRPTG